MITKPLPGEASEYAQSYINQLTETDLFEAFRNIGTQTLSLIKSIPEERGNFRYAQGKWTVKEVFQHVMDTERIFAYRALCFSRQDATPLPSFDENLYAPNSNCATRTLAEIAKEYAVIRQSSELMYLAMTEEMLDFKGTASGVSHSARILGWFAVGHNLHHNRVLEERYLAG